MHAEDEDRRDWLRVAFQERRGYWTPWLDELLTQAPDFFEAFLQFTSAPWNSDALQPRVKELVYIAIDAAVTHLYEPGLRKHMRDALAQGATPLDIVETLRLASGIGLLSTTVAAPFLLQALQQRGEAETALDDGRRERRNAFEATTGHWSDGLQALLLVDEQAFEIHADYLCTAWRTKSLDPVTRELICLAVHASSTLLHRPGIELHMTRALDAGATRAQLLEVLQLASVLGIHTCSVAMPVLAQAMEGRDAA